MTENWWKPYSPWIIFTHKILTHKIYIFYICIYIYFHWFFFQSYLNYSVIGYFGFQDLSSGLNSQFSNMPAIFGKNLGFHIILIIFPWCPCCYLQGGSLRATCYDSYLIKFFTGLKYTVKQKQTQPLKLLLGKKYCKLGQTNIVLHISSRKANFLSARAEEI